jgi:type II secretory pathway component PulC
MKRILFLTVLMALTGAMTARAQDSNSSTNSASSSDSRPSFETFQVIERNNVFNPYRQPQRRPGPPAVRVYSFTLNGIMTYENKGYAFFDGNAGSRGKALSTADTINGYRIAEITNNTVKLAAASNQFITLHVGMQMRREEKGPWKLVPSTAATMESPPSTASSDAGADDNSGGTASSAPVAMTPGADSAVIRKLMMQRRALEGGDTNSASSNADSNP